MPGPKDNHHGLFLQDPTGCSYDLPSRIPDAFPTHRRRSTTRSYSPRKPLPVRASPVSPPTSTPPPQTGGTGYWPGLPDESLLRKEVIQPHLPVRLPCYDFVPIASPTFDHSLPLRG
jgi:hypothetical protein